MVGLSRLKPPGETPPFLLHEEAGGLPSGGPLSSLLVHLHPTCFHGAFLWHYACLCITLPFKEDQSSGVSNLILI